MIYLVVVTHDVPSRTEIVDMTDTFFRTLNETLQKRDNVGLVFIDNGSQTNNRMTDVYLKYSNGFGVRQCMINPVNEPVSRCWNEAIKDKSDGDVIIMLNNDVVFNKVGWLDRLIAPLFQNSVGIAGSKMMTWNGFTFVEGAFFAFRVEAANRIKENGQWFDEQFDFTCEEADFCTRMRNAGLDVVSTGIEDQGYVTHLHHGTLSWSNEEGGWNGRSILEVMHECRRRLCRKYGKSEQVND